MTVTQRHYYPKAQRIWLSLNEASAGDRLGCGGHRLILWIAVALSALGEQKQGPRAPGAPLFNCHHASIPQDGASVQ